MSLCGAHAVLHAGQALSHSPSFVCQRLCTRTHLLLFISAFRVCTMVHFTRCCKQRTLSVLCRSAPLEVCMDYLEVPDTRSRTCNTESCEEQSSYWQLGRWSHSSACCGGGRQVRSASCIVSGTLADEELCSPVPHQLQLISSTSPCVNFGWYTSVWSQCSSQCGWGVATRRAQCVTLKNETAPDSFCPELQPQLKKDCYLGPCRQPSSLASGLDTSAVGVAQGVQRRLHAVLSGQDTAAFSSNLPAPIMDRHSSDHRPQVTLRKLLSESSISPEQEPIQCASSIFMDVYVY